MNGRDVTKLTKGELYHEIRKLSNSPEFIEDCIKENDRRMGLFVEEILGVPREVFE